MTATYRENPERRAPAGQIALTRLWEGGFAIFPEQLSIYRQLGQHLAGQTVADIGCGIGIGTNCLARRGVRVVGIDSDEQAIRFAQALYPDIHFARWDITRGPLASLVESIVAVELIEHIFDDVLALEHLLASCTRTAWLSTRNRRNPNLGQHAPINDYHVREYLPEELLAKLPRPVILRDYRTWDILSPDTDVTPLVYEVSH